MDENLKKRILIIEDDEYLRDLYMEILTAEGFMVDQAVDGEEGYQAVTRGGYDLVLLDIMLPKKDGIAILRDLAQNPPEGKNKVIVVLSNLGQESVIAEAVKLGARGHMIKSEMTPEQTVNEVKRYLAEST